MNFNELKHSQQLLKKKSFENTTQHQNMSYRKTEHFTTLSFPMHAKENFKVQVHTSPLVHHIKTKEPCWRYIVWSSDWNNFIWIWRNNLWSSEVNWTGPGYGSSGGVLWNIKLFYFIMRLVDMLYLFLTTFTEVNELQNKPVTCLCVHCPCEISKNGRK